MAWAGSAGRPGRGLGTASASPPGFHPPGLSDRERENEFLGLQASLDGSAANVRGSSVTCKATCGAGRGQRG